MKQDQKNLAAKIEKNTQSEITAELSDPELSGAFLNSVNTSSKSQKKEESQLSNKVLKILLDSGSDGDLMFHEKGTSMHFPYLARQVPNSWHTSNGDFLTKGRSKVNLRFFEYSNSKEYLVTPDVVEYDKKKMTEPMYDLILGCKSMKELGIVLDF
ncbi:hypothetical protein HJC23_006726 [Cyclotella cryptica]|uniref:Uncharacterized protein n=1 Tax=Cyclotella cryptica TaxID=29204 RepID=A0ABD3PNZ5_9STRA